MARGRLVLGAVLTAALAALAVAWLERRCTRPNPTATGRWFAVPPRPPPAEGWSLLDLRALNEQSAGDGGFIVARGGHLAHGETGASVRFWGVNGPPRELSGAALRRCARALAGRGVNLVRLHQGYFTASGEVDPQRVAHAIEVVEALKAEGIYTYLSIYYPLWLTPAQGTAWLQGYDGAKHPFAALEFNLDFQQRYRAWWSALLTTPSPATGRRLVDEPAVAGAEIQNEDSLLFPTLDAIPAPQRALLEARFGAWLAARYGSVTAALHSWGDPGDSGDAPAQGRAGVRPLWKVVAERTPRDRDTIRFLVALQTAFYAETYAHLRALGFRGLISASNWKTASPTLLDPLERLSNLPADVLDRHLYLDPARQGAEAAWSLRAGQTFEDRSALRLGTGEPGRPGALETPLSAARFEGKPSMISEVSWERPNRFRAEAPLYLAAYGALRGEDAIVHFWVEDCEGRSTTRGNAYPWPLMTPGQAGLFPAAALLFREGLVLRGDPVARVRLDPERLFALDGAARPPAGAAGGRPLHPWLHLAGPLEISFSNGPTSLEPGGWEGLIDDRARTVRSATGELRLDGGAGLLIIDAPRAQGALGALGSRPSGLETTDLRISSPLDPGQVIVVSLDGQPLSSSARMLVQTMSEERTTGFTAELLGSGRSRLLDPGGDPWLVRELEGTIRFKRADSASLRVTALDLDGRPAQEIGDARDFRLAPSTLYYLVHR